jgi:RNA polymerase sigma-70 factor (ECF subfamily)
LSARRRETLQSGSIPTGPSAGEAGPDRGLADSTELAGAFALYGPLVFRYLLRRTGDRATAEDLTQDVFADALAALPRLTDHGRPLLPWLYVVARRRAADAARQERRRARVALRLAPVAAPTDQQATTVRLLVEGIRSLPALQRRVVVMRLFEGRSFAEIGEVLAADEVACRMRFSRGLRALRATLRQAGLTLVPPPILGPLIDMQTSSELPSALSDFPSAFCYF